MYKNSGVGREGEVSIPSGYVFFAHLLHQTLSKHFRVSPFSIFFESYQSPPPRLSTNPYLRMHFPALPQTLTLLSLLACTPPLLLVSASPVALALPQAIPPNANIPPSTTNVITGKKGPDGKLIPQPAPGGQGDQALQKKQTISPTVNIAGGKGLSVIIKIAIEIAADTLKNLGEWNKARETFTQTTTLEMWNRNPDYAKFAAAICYNKGFRVKDPAGIAEQTSAKLELGLLNTDYECMFMAAPNQFFTDSDGGFINLSYRYDSRCSFDAATGDLTCVA
ncbi:hypothetical protein BCR34DRAFT_611436 [Clohesyomyces aquaticus]|uniref:DUF7888 domain-containing protein n=1 Tax=Clohesyomyces aquaticus TaxID=1231657 RepID=A0A1Y2A219_9PLEO|nr:hypothetical protein BCR34DRAFT_611436 [Clohesyomyces aquaticus]